MTLKTVYHALSTDLWDAADSSPGPHAGTYASARKDGHGRAILATERAHQSGVIQKRHVITEFSPAGQAEVIRRRKGNDASSDVVRWMRYDTLGRMVLNVDPHTTAGYTGPPSPDSAYSAPESLKTWRYQYNLSGDLLATQDARNCGVNFAYDALGRLLGEDYVPCDGQQQDYSPPVAGDITQNWEVRYYYDAAPLDGPKPFDAQYTTGRLVAVRDRAAETWTQVDGRGRVTETARRVAKPADASEVVSDIILDRYTPQWFKKAAAYDAADRVVAETIGGVGGAAPSAFNGSAASIPGTTATNQQIVRTSYSARGVVRNVDGSFGTLVKSITRRADGLVENLVYGDAAGTTTATSYDDRRRPTHIMTFRGAPSVWTALSTDGKGTDPTFQRLLEDTDYTYDIVGNPTEIRDWRDAAEWPTSSKPVTKKITYDDLYRATRVDYSYSTPDSTDTWASPFEQENGENDTEIDKRRAKPVPQLSFAKRPLWQRYEYDWLGNLTESDDDAHGIWDRSLGEQKHLNSGKPYQLSSAGNSVQIAGGQGRAGTVITKYDEAGNLTRLGVVRPSTSGVCLPGGSACTQEYAYAWDEVGRLVRARRWDSYEGSVDLTGANPPTTTPAIDLRHRYDASDNRVLKRVYATNIADQRHSLYVFGSFEVRRTVYETSAYKVDSLTAVPYAMANGVRLARLHFGAKNEPTVSGVDTNAPGWTGTSAQLHVLMELGDHLGSSSTVIDMASGELVEKASYLAYGARESDYRPDRWQGFREDYGFTGKEEDVEVGLVYFGKRFLSPQLGRWVSADPLAVHAPGEADLNLYAYVSGAVLQDIDPVGLETINYGQTMQDFKDATATHNSVVSGLKQDIATLQSTADWLDSKGAKTLTEATGGRVNGDGDLGLSSTGMRVRAGELQNALRDENEVYGIAKDNYGALMGTLERPMVTEMSPIDRAELKDGIKRANGALQSSLVAYGEAVENLKGSGGLAVVVVGYMIYSEMKQGKPDRAGAANLARVTARINSVIEEGGANRLIAKRTHVLQCTGRCREPRS